jgi:ribulose-phosphate 3-epimerase
MLAINPETAVNELIPYLKFFNHFQILGVNPGKAGQEFRSEVLEKIKFLRERSKSATIEVDGGVTPEVVRLVKKFGVDIIVSASYIFNSPDPKKAYEELQGI